MELLIAPVSGGRFPYQLHALKTLTKFSYKPDLILCSSGGNISSFIAMAGGWTENGIDRVILDICSELFIESWLPSIFDFLPSIIAGFFMGGIYRSSSKTINFFRTYFTPPSIMEIETWIGTVNGGTDRIGLFCNKTREGSLIKGDFFGENMFHCEPLKYMDGCIDKICKISVASSSIPIVVNPQNVDGADYVDSGIKIASPLAPLQDEIKNLMNERGGIHITYINGYNIESTENYKSNTLLTQGISATEQIVRGFILHDRMVAYEIISNGGKCHSISFGEDALDMVYDRIKNSKTSLLEIYPKSNIVLDYTEFKGCDVLSLIHSSSCLFRLWWTGDRDIFSGIPYLYNMSGYLFNI